MNWIQKILHIDHKHNPDFVQDFWKISGIITYSDTFFMPWEKKTSEKLELEVQKIILRVR